jgi:RNA polymerase sigma-70 factor (ECF subfamily)
MVTTSQNSLPDAGSQVPERPEEGASVAGSPEAQTWTRLVERIREGDQTAMEELYRVFSRGIRFFLCRQLGPQEIEDKVHDAFLTVVQSIIRGDLREPERLMGFVRTVVRRQVAASIDQAMQIRRETAEIEEGLSIPEGGRDPEQEAIRRQKVDMMIRLLNGISLRDREILTRFYLHEQSQEQICEEMKLSDTQFRLLKSRAKARFGDLGRKKLARKPLSRLSVRVSAGGGN